MSDDECLSPLMSLRPLKNSALLRTPLLGKLGTSISSSETPKNYSSNQPLHSFKTPDMLSRKKVTAAFLFSSCKKNEKLGNSANHAVLVGDSSDDEEQFQNSFRHIEQEKSSCADEDSITEYSLIRKWLINTEDSFTLSETGESKQDILTSQTGSNCTPGMPHVSTRPFLCNYEESVILLSSGEEDTSLGNEPSFVRDKAQASSSRPSAMPENECTRPAIHNTFLGGSPTTKTHSGIVKISNKEGELFAPNSSEDEFSLSLVKYEEILKTKIAGTQEKEGKFDSKKGQSHLVSRLRLPESPTSPNIPSPQSNLVNPSPQLKNLKNSSTALTFKTTLGKEVVGRQLLENDFVVESSDDEEKLMPLETKLSTWRNQKQERKFEPNDKETTVSSDNPNAKGSVVSRNNDTPTESVLTMGRYRVEAESDLEELFVSLTLTGDPKPKKTPKGRRKMKATADYVNDINRIEGKGSTFLSSLSANFPLELRHPEATPFIRTFRKTKDDLTRRLFDLFNEAVFDNMLQRDFFITWNNRLTRTAGYCRHFTRRENDVTFFESRIELSSKVVDTPCRLRDTLVHELCHAATWTIDNCRGGHGPIWRKWANRALRAFPELPPITRCHNYEIAYKYYYNCVVCSFSTGRHSKSVDIATCVCPMCRGRLELSKDPKNLSSSAAATSNTPTPSKTPRTPNAFALFVKEHYAAVKASKSEMPHAAVMKVLSTKFAESKKQSV